MGACNSGKNLSKKIQKDHQNEFNNDPGNKLENNSRDSQKERKDSDSWKGNKIINSSNIIVKNPISLNSSTKWDEVAKPSILSESELNTRLINSIFDFNSFNEKKVKFTFDKAKQGSFNQTKNNNHNNDEIGTYYSLEETQETQIKKNASFSFDSEFSHILKNINSSSTGILSTKILSLPERQWIKENISLSYLIKNNRVNFDSFILNKYIKERMKLNEHFNWFTWAIAINYIHNNNNNNNNSNNLNDKSIPGLTDISWLKGFKYKGVYIKIIKGSEEIKRLKREIKSWKLWFLEYLQIIDTVKNISELDNQKLLTNEVIFPLVSYAEINGVCIVTTALLPRNNLFGAGEDDSINITDFNIDDIKSNTFMKRLNKNNFVKLVDGENSKVKYMIVNATAVIPNLFKESNDNNDKGIVLIEGNKIIYPEIPECNNSEATIIPILCKHFNVEKTKLSSMLKIERNIRTFDISYRIITLKTNTYRNGNVKPGSVSGLSPLICKILPQENDLPGNLVMIYEINHSHYKINYPLIDKNIIYDNYFTVRTSFNLYLDKFSALLNDNKCIYDWENLNHFYKKYGVNKVFHLYILTKIANNDIADWIKIDIWTSFLKNYFYDETVVSELTIVDLIKAIINAVLSPGENKTQSLNVLKSISIALNTLILKYNRINYYIFGNTVNFGHWNKHALIWEELFTSARNRAITFLNAIENKLNIIINPVVKYQASICLENFIGKTKDDYIEVNKPKINSFINANEMSYYILAKLININERTLKEENQDIDPSCYSFDNSLKSNKRVTLYSNNINRMIIPNNWSTNYNILNSSRDINCSSMNLKNTNYNNNNVTMDANISNVFEMGNEPIKGYDNRSNGYKENQDLLRKECSKFWENYFSKYEMEFPAVLYKIKYENNKNTDETTYLSNRYTISNSATIFDWKSTVELLLNEVVSVCSDTAYTLINIYTYYFLNAFFIEIDYRKSQDIVNKINEILKTSVMYDNIHCEVIINTLKALLFEKIKYNICEEFYSNSLIFLLLNYGDPRGKNNTAHSSMLYPVWKLGRFTCIFESNADANDNWKEMFHCINYYYRKTRIKTRPKGGAFQGDGIEQEDNNRNADSNILKINKLYNSVAYKSKNDIQFVMSLRKSTLEKCNTINEDCNFDDELVERPTVKNFLHNSNLRETNKNKFIFHHISTDNFPVSNEQYMPCFNFPSISDTSPAHKAIFSTEDCFVFLLKHLSTLQHHHSCVYPRQYLINWDIHNIKGKKLKSSQGQKTSPFIYNYIWNTLNYKAISQGQILVSWGNNPHNETTHNNYEYLSMPRMCFKWKDVEIKSLAVGWEHNVVWSEDKRCYSWGNNQSGQCGIGEAFITPDPTNIVEWNNKDIIKVSCGNEHTLALTSSGELYGWGNSEDGLWCIEEKMIQYTPKKITMPKLNGNKIIDINCGSWHNIVIDDKYNLYSWGCNKGGQWGWSENFLNSIKDFPGFIPKPTQINIGNPIISVSSGEAHSIGLTPNGDVYSWGFSSNGQWGLGFCEDSFEPGKGMYSCRKFEPSKIPIRSDSKIIDVQCGKTFSMFINESNEWLACGVNNVNQLGLDNDVMPISLFNHCYDKQDLINFRCNDYVTPLKLEIFLNMKVLKISCGESHCLAMINDKSNNWTTLWSWGSSRFGQWGQGIKTKNSLPKPVNYFFQYKNSEITEVACGAFHSLCVLKRKDCLAEVVKKDSWMLLNLIKEWSPLE